MVSPDLLARIADLIDSAVLITRFGSLGQFDHRIIYINPAFTKLTGYTQNELIGRSPDVLCDPRTGTDKMMEFYGKCRQGENFSVTLDAFRKHGEFKLQLDVKPLFDDVQGSSFYVITCSEASVAVAAAALNTEVAASAPQHQPQEAFIAEEPVQQFVEIEPEAAVAVEVPQFISEVDSHFEPEENTQSTGDSLEQIINEIKKDPIFSQSYSLTEEEQKKELEEGSRVKAEIASQEKIAEYCKTQFLANMSHDLRTPLNAIIGFSEVIKDQLFGPIENPRYVSYAKDIYRSGQELLATISEIMELSEISPETEELEEEKINLGEIVDSVLEVLSPKAFEGDVKIIKALDAKDMRFRGDRRKIKQAVAGVLGNAIRYSQKSSKVEVSTGMSDKGDFRLVVYAKTANILGAKAGMGSLLGTITKKVENEYPEISLARKFIEAHDGRFNIFNSATSGTEITITLPATRLSLESDSKRLFKVIS